MSQPILSHDKQKTCCWNYILFGIFLVLALGIWLTHKNQELFLLINSYHNILPDQIWEFFNRISDSKFMILPILLVLITALKRRNQIINALLLVASYYILFTLLKKTIGEARPYVILPKDSFFWLNYSENAIKLAYKSFPSGHTGNMAVFAFALSHMFFARKCLLQFIMLLLVIIVGLARICTGWHWPLDVLASGLIGYILVKIILALDIGYLMRAKNN